MGKKINLSLLIVLAAYLARKYYFTVPLKSPIVEISTGKLQGIISQSRDGRDYFEYLGVPYARPPLKSLRYEPPEPLIKKWEGVRSAMEVGPSCLQFEMFEKHIEGSEDCLMLNIHTPRLGSTAKLPVLVWFHGGIYVFGTGNTYHADYLMDEEVVLVTVNYRLNSFGFLNTGDGLVRGNNGLKDQNMALQFIRKNIAVFGGDADHVTIFGESAGGGSVHYHLLSPMSKGLFHKAIAQSGLASMPWAVNKNPAAQAKRFASQVGCDTSDSKTMVKCLKGKSADELVAVHAETGDIMRPVNSLFIPTIEKEMNDGKSFLTEPSIKLIESGRSHQVPFLTGLNSAEGLLVSAPAVVNQTILLLLKNDWTKNIQKLMYFPENTLSDAVGEKIKSYYLGKEGIDTENPTKNIGPLTNMFSDAIWSLGFNLGINSHLKGKSQSAPLYLYYYDYPGDSLADILLCLKGAYHPVIEILWGKLSKWFKSNVLGQEFPYYGSAHADELAMEFYLPDFGFAVPKNSKHYNFSKNFIKMIINFVNSKNQGELEFMGKKFTPQEKNKPLMFMRISETPEMIPDPLDERIEFWKSLNLRI